jgi:DNA-binding transcriptional ArsR family regulator
VPESRQKPEPRRKFRSEHRFGDKGKPLVIDDPATFKALLDPLRHRIIGLLDEPKSIRQLAEALEMPAGRLYYHLDVLVERGLAKVIDHRTSGTNVERVFARAADRFQLSEEIARSPVARSGAVARLQRSVASHLDDFAATEGTPGNQEVRMAADVELWLTPAQAKQFVRKVNELVSSFKQSPRPRTARKYGFFGLLAPKREDSE